MAMKTIEERLKIPDGVEVSVDGNAIKAKGAKGSLQKNWTDRKIKVKVDGGELAFIADEKPSKRERRSICTLRAHVRNMLKGVSEGFSYKLKICSGHFPMNVSVSGDEFIVKNFLGEKTPRRVKLKSGVKVVIQAHDVSVEGTDKELVAQTAANIEQLTRRTNYDKRIFQDGIYIAHKDRIR